MAQIFFRKKNLGHGFDLWAEDDDCYTENTPVYTDTAQ